MDFLHSEAGHNSLLVLSVCSLIFGAFRGVSASRGRFISDTAKAVIQQLTAEKGMPEYGILFPDSADLIYSYGRYHYSLQTKFDELSQQLDSKKLPQMPKLDQSDRFLVRLYKRMPKLWWTAITLFWSTLVLWITVQQWPLPHTLGVTAAWLVGITVGMLATTIVCLVLSTPNAAMIAWMYSEKRRETYMAIARQQYQVRDELNRVGEILDYRARMEQWIRAYE